jgi:hypothetical protein
MNLFFCLGSGMRSDMVLSFCMALAGNGRACGPIGAGFNIDHFNAVISATRRPDDYAAPALMNDVRFGKQTRCGCAKD